MVQKSFFGDSSTCRSLLIVCGLVVAISVVGVSADAWTDARCTENEEQNCATKAICYHFRDEVTDAENAGCKCPAGYSGDGYNFPDPGNPFRGCSSTSWSLRFMLKGGSNIPGDQLQSVSGKTEMVDFQASHMAYFLTGVDDTSNEYLNPRSPVFSSIEHEVRGDDVVVSVLFGRNDVTNGAIGNYEGKLSADKALDFFSQTFGTASEQFGDDKSPPDAPLMKSDSGTTLGVRFNKPALLGTGKNEFTIFNTGTNPGVTMHTNSLSGIYTFTVGDTADFQTVIATGLEVETVAFEPVCSESGSTSGCWKVGVVFAVGQNNFNTFYLPRAEHSGYTGDSGETDLSESYAYDFVYSDWGLTVSDTFVQNNFPCTSDDYNATNTDTSPPTKVTTCCLKPFVEMYRPVQKFADLARTYSLFTDYDAACVEPDGGDTPIFRKGTSEIDGDNVLSNSGEMSYALPQNYVGADPWAEGLFDGMSHSFVANSAAVDPFLGVYRAFVYLDDLEVRSMAGKLSGTIGADYSVETFIGLADFTPTNNLVLDSGSKQWPITVSKTNYFSVSSHGENDYTFLSYVNMRLVEVYQADPDLQQNSEDVDFTRTDSTSKAQYVQVTFTLNDATYQPAEVPGADPSVPTVIPLDSVRVGQGVFFSDGNMAHSCTDYEDGAAAFAGTKKTNFDARFTPTCAPIAAMCSNPATIPNQFVSFNVPLGLDWLPGSSSDLGSNVFVDMVVTVQTSDPTTGVDNDKAEQMKTRLTGSIPVVDGGTNIFCDAIVAKLDLADIANVHLAVGIADTGEWSRITVFRDIATSMKTTPASASEFNTASIESGLMTLVLDGDDDFFGPAVPTGSDRLAASFGLQLEDVITIHVMEPTAGFGAGTKAGAVKALVDTAGEDNFIGGTLDLDGYNLNGAFRFTVNPDENYATLQPTDALLGECSFRATAVAGDVLFPETCILRRDVSHRVLTENAFEITAATNTEAAAGAFMQTILGENDYSLGVGPNFATEIISEFSINGRYKRAFWINPGYEWTPSQTNGMSKFSLTQKLFFFALIKLDEQFGNRRRLLTSKQEKVEAKEGMNSKTLEYKTSPAQMLADAMKYPVKQFKSWRVEMALTDAQACMERAELAADMKKGIKKLLEEHASAIKEVFVTSLKVDNNGVQCSRRRLARSLLAQSGATATVETMIQFDLSEDIEIDLEALNKEAKFVPIDGQGDVSLGGTKIEPGTEESTDEEKTDSGSSNIGPIVGGIVGGLAVIALVAFGVWKYGKGTSASEIEVGTAVPDKDDLLRELKSDAPAQPVQGLPAVVPKVEEAVF